MTYAFYLVTASVTGLLSSSTPAHLGYFSLTHSPEVSLSLSSILTVSALYFLCSVVFITASIITYSNWYMSGPTHHLRFILLMMMFVFSMALLIMSNSPSLVLLGWDGLGVSSYFLVTFYENNKVNGAASTTLVSNRVGDVFIILVVVMSLSSSTSTTHHFHHQSLLLALLLTSAAITKSAIFPYSTWLPEAMAAPTPISSLVHSSTLVTAGVYLLIQFHPSLEPTSLSGLTSVTTLTLIITSLFVLIGLDFKKIIALSTLSQLCFMMMGLISICPSLSMSHLLTHAYFKSAIFMSSGVLIHLSSGNQDGRLVSLPTHPTMTTALLISSASLMAVPCLAGFISKEALLLGLSGLPSMSMAAVTLLLAAGVSVLYSLRIIVFFYPCQPNSLTTIPLTLTPYIFASVGLVFLACISGYHVTCNLQEVSHPTNQHLSITINFIILVSGGVILLTTQPPLSIPYQTGFMGLGQLTYSFSPTSILVVSGSVSYFWETLAMESTTPKLMNMILTQASASLYKLSLPSFAWILISGPVLGVLLYSIGTQNLVGG